MQIDLAPILTQVVNAAAIVLTPVIGAMGVIVLKHVGNYFHVQVDQADQKTVSNAITNGIALIQQQTDSQISAHGIVTTQNQKVAMVAAYVMPKVSDALKRLKVADEQKLGQVIAARLAASPSLSSSRVPPPPPFVQAAPASVPSPRP